MSVRNRAARVGVFVLLSACLLVVLEGCKSGGRGPMERAGRSVDKAGEKVGDAFSK